MCLIALARDAHPELALVLVTNRDEFHDRPSAPMHWWPDRPILAGRDERSGGTWLAVSENGSLALVTNYRSGTADSGKRSRGEIPLRVLERGVTPETLADLFQARHSYGGFNLLTASSAGCFYAGSEDSVPFRRLHRGFYGLSNHLLQSDWPKVNRSRLLLKQILAGYCGAAAAADRPMRQLHNSLISALQDDRPASDSLLPNTGVGLSLERSLSPLFIRGETYGTRATTVITRDYQGCLTITEQQYGPNGIAGERLEFSLRPEVWRETGLSL